MWCNRKFLLLFNTQFDEEMVWFVLIFDLQTFKHRNFFFLYFPSIYFQKFIHLICKWVNRTMREEWMNDRFNNFIVHLFLFISFGQQLSFWDYEVYWIESNTYQCTGTQPSLLRLCSGQSFVFKGAVLCLKRLSFSVEFVMDLIILKCLKLSKGSIA